MTLFAQLSPRHTLFALALSLTVATPALADPWRAGPGMGADRPDCQYRNDLRQGMRGDMRDGDACPYMKQQMPPRAMQHSAMPAGSKVLGVMVSNLTNAVLDAAGLNYGISVERVQPDSAAAQAGIRAGDMITDFAGSPVYSAERLRWLVQKAETGKPLEVKLLRERQPVQLNISLTPPAKPASDDKPAHKVDA